MIITLIGVRWLSYLNRQTLRSREIGGIPDRRIRTSMVALKSLALFSSLSQHFRENHKIMKSWMSKFFMFLTFSLMWLIAYFRYLDRFYIKRFSKRTLEEVITIWTMCKLFIVLWLLVVDFPGCRQSVSNARVWLIQAKTHLCDFGIDPKGEFT